MPKLAPARAALPLLLATAVAAGCHRKRGPAPYYVGKLAVSEETLAGNPDLGMSAADLMDRLAVALDGSGRFEPLPGASGPHGAAASGKGPAYRCHADVSFTRESDEPADGGTSLRRAEVGVTLELYSGGEDGEHVRADASGVRLFDGSVAHPGDAAPRTHAFRGALDTALSRAVAQLVLELDAGRKNDMQLIADLSSADGGVRDCAVRQLADRRNPAAVPALIERLKDPDKQVVLRAMGALESLRDPRAVKPLIDLTERQDPAFVSQVVYVIGAIGGTDAEAFLFTLENGSQDPQVRAAAAEAAAELRRKRGAPDGGELQRAARR
ncbi:MAG TPA: HEAT repeat domain-containing protein [Myxococcales bacterium]|nr:HEAT repeat domain-containing protein [Myxococcales bacterium]